MVGVVVMIITAVLVGHNNNWKYSESANFH